MSKDVPTIGITMGDPLGVGAEIIVRALADRDAALCEKAHFVVFGFSDQIEFTADHLEAPLRFYRDHHENVRKYTSPLVALDYDEFNLPPVMPRGPSKVGGAASMAFCQDAIHAALDGQIDALVTAPISKTSWQMAKYKKWPGHTELLKELTGARHVAMMFHAPRLKVVLATIHDAIIRIRDKFTIGCVFNPIELADRALREWWGIERPVIGVAGLNPHAGENGHIGDEEQRIIGPAITMATEAGIDARGPFAGDTIFLKALDGEFDCVVAMYHDQGLIPVKLLGWEHAVNVTLGLPIIRTSPDHGTAFDIAGKFEASPSSMIAAIELAIELANPRTT